MVYYVSKIARLAQLVEQLIYTEKVGGSNPSARTRIELDGFLEAKMRDALRASRILASKKPMSSLMVRLFYQIRTYFQNR